jgi:anti-anti-sigma factor
VSLKQYEKNGACIIVLPEQLMMADCNEVRAIFKQILESSTLPVLLDFSELVFMDSSGLGVLVNAHQTAKDAVLMFALFNIKPTVLSLIELTQLDQVFTIYADEQAVYEAVERR